MTAVTMQSNKIVSNEVKTRATVWEKSNKFFGQPNIYTYLSVFLVSISKAEAMYLLASTYYISVSSLQTVPPKDFALLSFISLPKKLRPLPGTVTHEWSVSSMKPKQRQEVCLLDHTFILIKGAGNTIFHLET